MIQNFQYTARNYTPSVNLDVLNNTFNTLQQGHLQAVKAASDLEVAVANLDMDSSESGFKNELVNEIKQQVAAGTIYGNSYGALDDLIATSGELASSNRVIGRLKANQAKKAYDAKVDAMNITEGMKQMYKEQNPYHYTDGDIDPNTGRYKIGTVWEPNTNPVQTVPKASIFQYALSIAAKEAGGGESISFLDANGNETKDASKSEDGTMYRKVGNKYERLPADKIKKAINVALDAIPGARDSINQDYNYERWKYDKLVEANKKNGGDITPYVEGFTDKNGKVYDEDDWFAKQSGAFANVASYNYEYSTMDFGSALANRRNRQIKAAAAAQAAAQSASSGTNGTAQIAGGYEKVHTNSYNNSLALKHNTNKVGLSILQRHGLYKNADTISDVIYSLRQKGVGVTGPGTAVNYILRNNKSMSASERLALRNAFQGYVSANANVRKYTQAAKGDTDALKFMEDANNGVYTNSNKYSKAIIANRNAFLKTYNGRRYDVGDNVMMDIAKRYGVGNPMELNRFGIKVNKRDDDSYDVIFDKTNLDAMPKFESNLRKADSEVSSGLWDWGKKLFTGEASKGNYSYYNIKKDGTEQFRITRKLLSNSSASQMTTKPYNSVTGKFEMTADVDSEGAADIYDHALEKGATAYKKAGVVDGTVPYSVYSNRSVVSMEADNLLASGVIDEKTAKAMAAKGDAAVDNMFKYGNFASGAIYEADAAGNLGHQVTNAQDAQELIQRMYIKNPELVGRGVKATGVGGNQELAYKLSFTIPKGFGVGKYKDGQTVNFVIKGVNTEGTDFNPNMNTYTIARDAIMGAKATGGYAQTIGYDNFLGDTNIYHKSNGTYESTAFGTRRNYKNDEEARQLADALFSLEQLKGNITDGTVNMTDPYAVAQVKNSIASLSNHISKLTGQPTNRIEFQINNYLTH